MSSLRRTHDILVDERLAGVVGDAARRARDRVSEDMPGVGGDITRWIAALTSGAPPERYFLHPEAFPILFFPWELEKSLRGRVDQAHQAAISYAGINLYYFVRMIDDVMDGDQTVKVHLLPALGHFYHEAERVLARLCPATHPFWKAYGRHWRTGAPCTGCSPMGCMARTLPPEFPPDDFLETADVRLWEHATGIRPDEQAASTLDELALLERVDLFRALPVDTLVDLSAHLIRQKYAGGEPIIWAGDRGTDVCVLVAGSAEVIAAESEQIVGTIAAGQTSGEMACLTLEPRVSSVRASRARCRS